MTKQIDEMDAEELNCLTMNRDQIIGDRILTEVGYATIVDVAYPLVVVTIEGIATISPKV